ncbi:hypothetical protein [Candidatus Poriferisodalis sp.]|uniref:hypothetical protein n=1 Tax=Candidatus Poriferisodalis sp. TaxID=3101277 RepID=UPI003B021DA6
MPIRRPGRTQPAPSCGPREARPDLVGLLHTPAITAGEIQAVYELTPARASQILHQLADAGIVRLSEHRAGRSRVWVAHDVIDAIDTINATVPRRLIDASDAGNSGAV